MGSRIGGNGKAPASSSSSSSSPLRAVWAACLALCLLLSCFSSPCEGRKLLLAEAEAEGGNKKVMYFEGDLVLRVPPPPSVVGGGGGGGEEPAVVAAVPVPRGFAATGRAARLMRSVPSPGGVGH